MKNPNKITIGLFGTCDDINWRDSFIQRYDDFGIESFNPVVENWTERLDMSRANLCDDPTIEENDYLNKSEIILFPVLKESLGLGSLAETGFSIQRVVRSLMHGRPQFMIVLIDDTCTDHRKGEVLRRESVRSRALVKSKISETLLWPNITMVDTLEEMFDLSIQLFEIVLTGIELKYRRK